MFSAKNYKIITDSKNIERNSLKIISLDEVNKSLADEFTKRKNEMGLKFFSQYYHDINQDIKYYVSSNPDWTKYYLKNNLIEHDHLYEEGVKLDNYLSKYGKKTYNKLFYWHTIDMVRQEHKEVNDERLIYAKHDHGVGHLQKYNNLIIATVLSGDIKDKNFYRKLRPNDFEVMGNLSRKSIINI